MTNNLVKALMILAFTTSPVVAKSTHHHHHRVKHRHSQAQLPHDDLTCLTNTAYREAGNSEANLQAVANVAKNRLIHGWGKSYCHVIRTGRFVYSVRHPNASQYARAHDIAHKVMAGELPDNTGGAVYFHAQHLRHRPRWAKPQYLSARIGGNVFYRDGSSTLHLADGNDYSGNDAENGPLPSIDEARKAILD
ncbi:MAG: cell wall hydrolase [Methylococcaceae bacterium]|nr:cell wall hydrolase [Methylococcaceae bacterium]